MVGRKYNSRPGEEGHGSCLAGMEPGEGVWLGPPLGFIPEAEAKRAHREGQCDSAPHLTTSAPTRAPQRLSKPTSTCSCSSLKLATGRHMHRVTGSILPPRSGFHCSDPATYQPLHVRSGQGHCHVAVPWESGSGQPLHIPTPRESQ